MELQPLDPRLLALIVKDEEDILTPRAEKRRAAIEFNPCPACGSDMQEVLSPGPVFTDNEPLPRTVGKCSRCQYTYDPHNGLVIHTGDPKERLNEPFPIIKPAEE